MPVIVYQSLNSNSSTTHDISATNSQYFTRMTHEHSVREDVNPWALSYPIATNVSPHIPVQGPPNLLPTAKKGYLAKGNISNSQFMGMLEVKARQLHQSQFRLQEGRCDLLVFGELDSTNTAWSSFAAHAGPSLPMPSTATKACQCFSAHSSHSGVKVIAADTSWIAVKCINIIALFVHVPNDIAGSAHSLVAYYRKIFNTVSTVQDGGIIDIVMGDTNQKSPNVTPKVVTAAFGSDFEDAHDEDEIIVSDAHDKTVYGTNAKGTKKYDVAVYNTDTIDTISVCYLSQFTPIGGSVAAVTDHMAVSVAIDK